MSSEFFAHIPDEEIKVGKRPAAKLEFACEHCGGSGKVKKTYGYTPFTQRTYENTCKVCKGKGGFKTDARTRSVARNAAAASKQKKLVASLEQFEAQHPGLLTFLRKATWSSFAQSMADAVNKYGSLTEKQLAAALSMKAKADAKAAERAADAAKRTVELDASAIKALFATAAQNGLKRRALLAGAAEGEGTLRLSPASEHGQNAGAIWIKADGEFVGGIKADGRFTPRKGTPEWVAKAIERVCHDPAGEARLFGQRTGSCMCCGRELTKHASIEAGIGPICAAKWGL